MIKITSGGLVVTDGKKILLDRTYNTSPTRGVVSVFKVGIGSTDVTITDTDLENAIPITGQEDVDDCNVTTGWADTADTTLSVNSSSYKIANALNWTKDAGTITECSSAKTTTSVDFTSKELSIWLFIKDATALAKLATTDALTIHFGSSNSDYFVWTKDNADLIAGQWNLITGLTSANADSETGTVVLGSCDYTKIILTAAASANTWSDGDFIIDQIIVISSDDYKKVFESGYPALDFNTLQATIRTRINTVEANGYPLREVGIFNTDGTPLMESRDTHALVSKTSDEEIIYVFKNTIE